MSLKKTLKLIPKNLTEDQRPLRVHLTNGTRKNKKESTWSTFQAGHGQNSLLRRRPFTL